jgi:rhodanese-related sulfurtransferase
MSTILTIAASALLIWFIFTNFVPINGLKNLNGEQFEKRLTNHKGMILIDVREPHEYNKGYIPGAVNIPLSQIKDRYNEIPKDKEIYLYCRSGKRSKQSAKHLIREGYTDLFHLQGGIMAWNGQIRN